MACPSAFLSIEQATESLGTELHQTSSPATPFYNSVPRGMFKKNSGVTQTTFTIGRSEVLGKALGWNAISASGNITTGAACADTFLDVAMGFDTATFAPKALHLKGPDLCADQFTFQHQPAKFMGRYVALLANYVKRKVDVEFRDQYVRFGNKLSILNGAFSNAGAFIQSGTATNPTVEPTSQLTWAFLDAVAARMIRDGATSGDSGGTIEIGPFGPIFEIHIGLEALQALMANVPAIYTGFNYAYMGKGKDSPTQLAVGQSITIKNWKFIPTTHPPRANFTGGIVTEVEAFVSTAASGGGTKSIENSVYTNADLEYAIIPHLDTFTANIVSPDDAGLDFDPRSWTGNWKFVTGSSRTMLPAAACFDPLMKWGAHFSEYMYAPEPVRPEFAWTLMFRRCSTTQAVASCAS